MKKIGLNIVCIGVVLTMCLGVFCACNCGEDDFRNPIIGEPVDGEFYSLKEAYDHGWISKADLRNIAYHKTGDAQNNCFVHTSKNPETLAAETEYAIKTAWLSKAGTVSSSQSLEDIEITGYYGVYNDLIAVLIRGYADFPAVIYTETIDGIEFTYGDMNTIKLWKNFN